MRLFLDEGWRVANDHEVWAADGLHQIADCDVPGQPGRNPYTEAAARAELIALLPMLVKALETAEYQLDVEGSSDAASETISQALAKIREVSV